MEKQSSMVLPEWPVFHENLQWRRSLGIICKPNSALSESYPDKLTSGLYCATSSVASFSNRQIFHLARGLWGQARWADMRGLCGSEIDKNTDLVMRSRMSSLRPRADVICLSRRENNNSKRILKVSHLSTFVKSSGPSKRKTHTSGLSSPCPCFSSVERKKYCDLGLKETC